MKTKTKRGILFLCAALFLATIGAMITFVYGNAVSSKTDFDERITFSSEYAVGETLYIPQIKAVREGKACAVSAVLLKDFNQLAVLSEDERQKEYQFVEPGEYCLIYSAVASDGSISQKQFFFTVKDTVYFDVKLNTLYKKGSSFSLPAEYVNGTERGPACYKTTGPDGMPLYMEEKLIFNASGTYSVTYFIVLDGKNYERTYFIDVPEFVTPADYFSNVNGITAIDPAIEGPAYAEKGSGVRITSGDRNGIVKFNHVIDLNCLDENTQLLKLLPLSTDGYLPLNKITVDLIDVYDPSNVISYRMYNEIYTGNDREWTFIDVGYNGDFYSPDSAGGVKTTYPGAISSTHFNGSFLEFEHQQGTAFGKAYWFEIQVDYANRAFYALTGSHYIKAHTKLVDLDDPEHVGADNLWKGFTTGEIYLQIRFDCAGGNSGIIIEEIAGESFAFDNVESVRGPSFFLDYEMNRLPDGLVGQSYHIPVVERSVDIVDGTIYHPEYSVVILLRNNLGLFRPYDAIYDQNGNFLPEEEGDYRLEYTMEDSSGNLTEKSVNFRISASRNEPRVLPLEINDLIVGTQISLPAITVENVSFIDEQSVECFYNDNNISDQIGGKIFLQEKGVLRYEYYFRDYIGTELEGFFEFEIKVSKDPILTLKSYLPQYAFENQTLLLPDFDAVDYNENADDNLVKSITVNGKNIDMLSRKYEVTEKAGEEIAIRFSAGSAVMERKMKVLAGDYYGDRFIFTDEDNAEKENTAEGVKFVLSADNEIDFVNPIVIPENDGLIFAFNYEEMQGGSIDLILTDVQNAEQQIVLRFTGNGVQLNKTGIAYKPPVNTDGNVELSFIKSAATFENLFLVDTYENGSAFKGFSSGMINLKIEFNGARGTFYMNRIGYYTLRSSFLGGELRPFTDNRTPELVFTKSIFEQEFAVNQPVCLPAVQAWSAMSGMASVKVSVVHEGKTYVEEADASNDIYFTPDSFGEYNVNYSITNAAGRTSVSREVIRIRNTAEPEIKVSEKIEENYKVGDTLKLGAITVEGVSEGYNVVIYIVTPDGVYLPFEDSYRFVKSGTYRLVIQAKDTFTQGVRVFTISVEGK